MDTIRVYRFHAQLLDYCSPTWRRFEIDSGKTVAELAYTLMSLFNMNGSHLFSVNEILQESANPPRYQLPYDPDEDIFDNEEYFRADQITLREIERADNWQLTFCYDFGDDWQVLLKLESAEEREAALQDFPMVSEGKGWGIIEDCGGTWDMEELLENAKQGDEDAREYLSVYLDMTKINWASIDSYFMQFDKDEHNKNIQENIEILKTHYEADLPKLLRQ
ncbi:plasmid pRiA4b ORF-3 family protein [Stenoxybacter acetivorans]|uniref:plasmid pRiA4b ORF-3 family protein n=1 Tax=Stenoxybacter acetivorans TaxID=422441 RepID=UPI00056338AF|nr:plasmid pRiA4b ORF-3 family protein [Stenoxybacter acetivorans]